MPDQSPTIEDAFMAHKQIKTMIRKTQLIKSSWLANHCQAEVFLKLESQQITGSFKLRGAANKLMSLTAVEQSKGVITVSSGNHGKAVAYVARKLGIRAVVCISENVPENKTKAIRDFGAEVINAGQTYDDASAEADRLKDEWGLVMIHPFDDRFIIAGQSTIGLELMEDYPQIDTVIAPLSGGGLLGGIAMALKSMKPSIRTIGVSMAAGPAMIESLKAGQIVEVDEKPTLADALAGGLGEGNRHTFDLIKKFVDETIVVSEDEIAEAMSFALQKHQIVVEGGGAVGLAALMYNRVEDYGSNIVIVISGKNVDMHTLLDVARKPYPYQQIG